MEGLGYGEELRSEVVRLFSDVVRKLFRSVQACVQRRCGNCSEVVNKLLEW